MSCVFTMSPYEMGRVGTIRDSSPHSCSLSPRSPQPLLTLSPSSPSSSFSQGLSISPGALSHSTLPLATQPTAGGHPFCNLSPCATPLGLHLPLTNPYKKFYGPHSMFYNQKRPPYDILQQKDDILQQKDEVLCFLINS